MTNETSQTSTTEPKQIPFGTRLQSAREALGLDRKDAAAQLRLNENIISMMEKDRYPADLPVTFIRGYIRAYGKLLQIPELEIKKAIEPIKPKATTQEFVSLKAPLQVTSDNSFMQVFTYLIIFTMIGLVGMWWYNHPTSSPSATIETQITAEGLPANPAPAVATEPVVAQTATPAPAAPTPNQTLSNGNAAAPAPTPTNVAQAPTVHTEQAPVAESAPIEPSTTTAANNTATTPTAAPEDTSAPEHAAPVVHKKRHPVVEDDEDDEEDGQQQEKVSQPFEPSEIRSGHED